MLLSPLLAGKGCSADAEPMDLSRFQWINRLLLIFAPSDESLPLISMQRSLTDNRLQVEDRDLVVFKILEAGESTMDSKPINLQTVQRLQEKFTITRGRFTVILIGKDGGIKLKRSEQTSLKDIFVLIDAMPMRQEEMRRRPE